MSLEAYHVWKELTSINFITAVEFFYWGGGIIGSVAVM